MNSRTIACLPLLATLVLSACQGVSTAPADRPRIEVEIVTAVDDGFYAPMADDVGRDAVPGILLSAVEPVADFKLRFYPVHTDSYGENQDRPPYVMTIEAVRLDVDREMKIQRGDPKNEEEPAETAIARVRKITCAVDVRFEKRRPNAPSLRVGVEQGDGTASPSSKDASATFLLRRFSNEENDTEITEDMIRGAIDRAIQSAFTRLQRAVDRELKLME